VGKCEGKRPLGRLGHRWNDNIKVDHKQVGCKDVDWIYLAQVKVRQWTLVNEVRNLQVL
jgi:hypothetical protein